MPLDQTKRDVKNNLVVVTLFESYLSKFILENTQFYQDIYFKLFNRIESLIKDNPEQHAAIIAFFKGKAGLTMSRYRFSIFTRVNACYPGYDSLDALRTNFKLHPSEEFIKIIGDELLNIQLNTTATKSPKFFLTSVSGHRSPENPQRCKQLFAPENRGVNSTIDQFSDDDEVEPETRNLGIVTEEFTPAELRNYFEQAVHSAKFNFRPNEDSYVANWLRTRHLPVIAGASGSTDMYFSRILPLVDLKKDEIQMLVLAQACSRVAQGHHSFFEAMLVADYFGYKLTDKDNLLDYYLQCVPEIILTDPKFQDFLNSETIKPLLNNMPLLDSSYRSSPAEFASLNFTVSPTK